MQRQLSKLLWQYCVFMVLLTLFQDACASHAEGMRRAYTVDDMLRIEGIGDLKFGPNGKSIVLEYLPPYEERGQYGIDRGGQILEVSLSAERQATPLFEHQPGEKYWLGATSPDGRRLLVFRASRERLQIGIYDFETNDLAFIDEIPQVNERFEMNSPIWMNEGEIVFSTSGPDSSQYGIRERPYVADRTSSLREKAFAGGYSGASVSTDPADHWFSGYLVRYNVNTKRISTIGEGRFGDLSLSADGKKLAALRLGQRRLHFPVDQLTDYIRFDTQLYLFDLETDLARSLLPDMHVSMGSLRWSDTDSKLSFFAWDVDKAMHGGSHYVMDSGSIIPIQIRGFIPSWLSLAGSGVQKRPIAAEWLQRQLIIHGVMDAPIHPEEVERPPLVNVNSSKAKWYEIKIGTMTAGTLSKSGEQSHEVRWLRDGRLLLQSDQAIIIASDYATQTRLDIENHDSTQVLNGRGSDKIDDTIVFTTEVEGNHELGFLDLTRNELIAPTTRFTGRVLAWAANTQQVIVREDTEDGGALYLRSAAGAQVAIFKFNEHMSDIEHPNWRTIEYPGVDGFETYSCIILPYNYDRQKSYPTIVDIYPGTGKECRNGSRIRPKPLGYSFPFHNNNDVLSANGYLVVVPSNDYSTSYVNGTLFGGLKDQVDVALEALIDAGMSDPDRIGIWGFSNGSMAGLWLASVSDRYKAVVPMFGASSPHIEYFGGASPPTFQMYLGTPIGHLVQYEAAGGAMPHSMGRSAIIDPIGYVKASPLDRAKFFCSPVMMVHSDLDGFTPFHYEALFSAMYRLGKRADLVRYYGEGHGLRSPGNIRDFYGRVLEFFDKHVAIGRPMTRCNGAIGR